MSKVKINLGGTRYKVFRDCRVSVREPGGGTGQFGGVLAGYGTSELNALVGRWSSKPMKGRSGLATDVQSAKPWPGAELRDRERSHLLAMVLAG